MASKTVTASCSNITALINRQFEHRSTASHETATTKYYLKSNISVVQLLELLFLQKLKND